MDGYRILAPLCLDAFHRDTETIPDTAVRIEPVGELLSRFLHQPPGPGYETKRAVPFGQEVFSLTFLTGNELDQLNRFKVLKKQVEWACGRFAGKSLVRDLLMPDKGLEEVRIAYRTQGAPYVEDLEGHCLSLSHSGEFTAAALGLVPGKVLGIDIEAVGPMPTPGFMKTAFTAGEIEAMAPGKEAVFRCWTLKEAYLKYIGKGFNESLHHVEVLGDTIRHRGEVQKVVCRSWLLDRGYAVGLVSGVTL
jgi:4'-phosphopantetheinyl transferase